MTEEKRQGAHRRTPEVEEIVIDKKLLVQPKSWAADQWGNFLEAIGANAGNFLLVFFFILLCVIADEILAKF